MRIASVIPSIAPRIGGPAIGLLTAVGPLAREGIETTVFATDMGRAASARSAERISVEELRRQAGSGADRVRLFRARPPYRFAFSPAMARALHEESGFDLVRIHSLFLYPQYAAWRYCRATATPYMVSIHGSLDTYLRRRGRVRKRVVSWIWQEEMLRRASAVHVATEGEAAAVTEVLPGLPLVIVPNGFDTARLEPTSRDSNFRERFLGGHEGPVVLFLGRISYKKGLDLLLEAFSMVINEVPEARLAIVGPDDEALQPSLEAQARRLSLSANVSFVGPLYGQDRLDAFATASMWVLPSHAENFGSAAVEAMAAGLPVVVSPGVNLAVEIAQAQAGLVVPLTGGGVRDGIIRLLRDPALQGRLAVNGRALARTFDWSVVAPHLADAYRSAAERGSPYSGHG